MCLWLAHRSVVPYQAESIIYCRLQIVCNEFRAIDHPSASVHLKINVLCRLFAHKQALAATANAILLQKCLKQRIWDNSGVECMQLHGVGDKTSKLLAAAKLSKLRQLDAADPRKIEAVTQRKYPFGKSYDSANDHKGCPAYASCADHIGSIYW